MSVYMIDASAVYTTRQGRVLVIIFHLIIQTITNAQMLTEERVGFYECDESEIFLKNVRNSVNC